MTPYEFFRAGSRLIGVYVLWTGLTYFSTAFNVIRDFSHPASTSATGYLIHGMVDLAVGSYLLFSSHLPDYLYSRRMNGEENIDETEQES
jgi:hypothetical protein